MIQLTADLKNSIVKKQEEYSNGYESGLLIRSP